MARKYTKMEILSEEVFRRKEAGETNREIAESYELTKDQIKHLVKRQNRKARLIAKGYVPHTSQAYFNLSHEYHFRPALSSPGCPYDNAAMENFFVCSTGIGPQVQLKAVGCFLYATMERW